MALGDHQETLNETDIEFRRHASERLTHVEAGHMPDHAGATPDAGTIETIKHRSSLIGQRRKLNLRATLARNAQT
ncbi:MAG: hypothetical protein AB7E84_20295 [Xanthobacteraceae bacterium]